jgi:hypothetical protein
MVQEIGPFMVLLYEAAAREIPPAPSFSGAPRFDWFVKVYADENGMPLVELDVRLGERGHRCNWTAEMIRDFGFARWPSMIEEGLDRVRRGIGIKL